MMRKKDKSRDERINGLILLIEEKDKQIEALAGVKAKTEADNRFMREVMASMNHEIRTPGCGIQGISQFMFEKAENLTEEHQGVFKLISDASTRLLNTWSEFYDFWIMIYGGKNVFNTETDITGLLQQMYTGFLPEAEGKGISLNIKIPSLSGEKVLVTDPGILRRIFKELLSNAIKHTSRGSVEFGIVPQGERDNPAGLSCMPQEIEFYVKDTGDGIFKRQKDNINEWFNQAGFSGEHHWNFTGHTITLIRTYTVALGGRIRLESEEGNGTVFYFTVPLNPVQADATTPEQQCRKFHK